MRVIGGPVGGSVAEAAVPRAQQRHAVVDHAGQDARDHRMDEQLQGSQLDRGRGLAVIGRVGEDLIGGDGDVP